MIFITSDHIESIIENVLGKLAFVRDRGSLDSALSRARNALSFSDLDVFTAAAYYLVGIAKNHPMADGNKRLAWATARVFLSINGYDLNHQNEDSCVEITVAAASGDVTIEKVSGFFRRSSMPKEE